MQFFFITISYIIARYVYDVNFLNLSIMCVIGLLIYKIDKYVQGYYHTYTIFEPFKFVISSFLCKTVITYTYD